MYERRFAGVQDIPALIVYARPSGLTPDDLPGVVERVTEAARVEGLPSYVWAPVGLRRGGRPARA